MVNAVELLVVFDQETGIGAARIMSLSYEFSHNDFPC